jgi:SM-20-related protein
MSSQPADLGPMPPFRVYDDFLDAALRDSLLEWALANRALFRPSRLGGNVYDPAARTSLSVAHGDAGPWRGPMTGHIRALAPELCRDVGLKPFEPSAVEIEMTAYGDGAHFKVHIDTMTGKLRRDSHRLLSGVYYFHAEPRRFSGGALRFHRFGTSKALPGDFLDVEPEPNRFIAFPSWATHEVRKVGVPSGRFEDSRFAINCWFYRGA